MEGKIKVIIKRPDEKVGHVTNISNTLKNLQRTVDGLIETVTVAEGCVCICNEEGKIRQLQPNFWLGTIFPDRICGTAIIAGIDGENFTDVPISMPVWKKLLQIWGNNIE